MGFQSLRDKLVKNSTIKETAVLTESKVYGKKDLITTPVPIINAALSAKLDGGLTPGLTVIAGESKHFKSNFMLLMASSYLKKYDDAIILFYDSEFGTSESYIESFGIDPERIVHTPITDIEKLKHDIAQQLDSITREDHIIVLIDSIGNLASKKEAADALSGNDAQDMSRQKQLKSLFRIVTPHLTLKNIPMVVINHIYMCGTKDMTITTPTGAVKFDEIKVDDLVLTTNGYEKVLNKVSFEQTPITEIELEDGTLLEFTDGHRFKVDGNWVYVDDLKEGMFLDVV